MAGSNPPAATRYTPGTWIGVVRSGTVVLLRPDAAPGLVDSLWELLAAGPEVHEVLDAVTSASGGSLARLPWFGIVDVRDAMHVFLRGEIDLDVRHAGGDAALSGRDVTTWTERRFAAPEHFSLSIPGATGASGATGAGTGLPLADGVVLLQGLSATFAGQPAPAKSAEALPLPPRSRPPPCPPRYRPPPCWRPPKPTSRQKRLPGRAMTTFPRKPWWNCRRMTSTMPPRAPTPRRKHPWTPDRN